jgi:hypothetical protein
MVANNQQHLWNVQTFPHTLTTKYGGIPFVILDIPKIVMDDNFHEVWEANKKPILRIKADQRNPLSFEESAIKAAKDPWWQNQWVEANWDGIVAFNKDCADDRWTNPLVDGKTLFPKFFQQLHDYLPIRHLNQVQFWSNLIPIGFHRDLNEQLPIPTSMRIVIEDNNPKPTFMLEAIPEEKKDTFISKRPQDAVNPKFVDVSKTESNTFAYNNKDWAHGALKLEGHSKILCTMAIDYDWSKYDNLIARSIAKYGNNLP